MTNHTDNVGDDATATTALDVDRPHSVRIATVVWGFILLGIAALFFSLIQFDVTRVNLGIVAAWVVIGIGSLAIVGGLVGAAVRRR